MSSVRVCVPQPTERTDPWWPGRHVMSGGTVVPAMQVRLAGFRKVPGLTRLSSPRKVGRAVTAQRPRTLGL